MQLKKLPNGIKGIFRYFLTLGLVIRSYALAPFSKRFRNLFMLVSKNSRVGGLLGDTKPDWIPAIKSISAKSLIQAPDIRLPFEPVIDGNVSAFELMILAGLVRQTQPQRIFEIGTFNGLTSLTMALNAPASTQLFTLDLPPQQRHETQHAVLDGDKHFIGAVRLGELFQRGAHPPEEKKITQLLGDSAAFDYTPHINATDFVFVDGSHAYDYVMSDSKNALRLLRNGRGIILWHDYNTFWPDTIRALEELNLRQEFKPLYHIEGTAFVILRRDV